MSKITYDYIVDLENNLCSCVIKDGKNIFTGQAHCHPEDQDFQNKLTGSIIAEARAEIAQFQHIRDNELRPQLKALQQLYYSMNHSKHFNPKSYEAKMLTRAIKRTEEELDITRAAIARLRAETNQFITDKDNLYKTLRQKRAGQDNTKDSE